MNSSARLQAYAVDIAAWDRDVEFAVFPVGARDKLAVISPTDCAMKWITPGRRYLFKESRRPFADQFWAEVVAYRIGCLLGACVPPAFAAFDSESGRSGALIEWFYVDNAHRFVHAGDFLQRRRPSFDRRLGTDHNLVDNGLILRALKPNASSLDVGRTWRHWWMTALVFDALIGNTDRHQDNWGFLFDASGDPLSTVQLAPLFDNGTSLGHERFEAKVARWSEADIERYISKGEHHVRWAHGHARDGHIALVKKALLIWPGTKETTAAAIHQIDRSLLEMSLQDLPGLRHPVPLSSWRLSFMLALLGKRLLQLQEIFK